MSHHPEQDRFLKRHDKESLLRQRGLVVWLCGLSGSGKSTIAAAVERVLHKQGRFVVVLDSENCRNGLNSNLGFSDQDRLEDVRRLAEVARVLVAQGIIVLVSSNSPRGELRDLARGLLGNDLFEVYVEASFATCEKRDVKGLRAKAARGEIEHFTGQDGSFEPPQSPTLTINTENCSVQDAAVELLEAITDRIALG
jgi:adenylylsulfate kinase